MPPARQEILTQADVERERDGKFKAGHAGHPGAGRPPGAQALISKEIRGMVLEALQGVGGVNYLMAVAITKPEVFCGLVGKVLPPEEKAPPDPDAVISEVRRTVVLMPPKK